MKMEVTQFTLTEFEAYLAANPKPEFKNENRKKAFEQFEKEYEYSKLVNVFKVRVLKDKGSTADTFEFVLERRVTQNPEEKVRSEIVSKPETRKSSKDFEREKNVRRPRSLLILDMKAELISQASKFVELLKDSKSESLMHVPFLIKAIEGADLTNITEVIAIQTLALSLEIIFRNEKLQNGWALGAPLRLINAYLTLLIDKRPLFDVSELKYLYKKINKTPDAKSVVPHQKANPPAQA